jgi:hypothetical protein
MTRMTRLAGPRAPAYSSSESVYSLSLPLPLSLYSLLLPLAYEYSLPPPPRPLPPPAVCGERDPLLSASTTGVSLSPLRRLLPPAPRERSEPPFEATDPGVSAPAPARTLGAPFIDATLDATRAVAATRAAGESRRPPRSASAYRRATRRREINQALKQGVTRQVSFTYYFAQTEFACMLSLWLMGSSVDELD